MEIPRGRSRTESRWTGGLRETGLFGNFCSDSFKRAAHELGIFEMDASSTKLAWIEPEIVELDVLETHAQPGGGADVGGNPFPDCQAS